MVQSSESMFTTGDVARYLDISQSTVINYIEKGFLKPDLTLPSSNARSGRRKFKKETVDAFYEKYLQ